MTKITASFKNDKIHKIWYLLMVTAIKWRPVLAVKTRLNYTK